jgi:hypothetical protein
MSTHTAQNSPVSVQERTDDARLKEKLLGMAARRSPEVRNGRFFYSKDLNALTYWYEDHKDSTRMVYIADEG